MYSTYKKLSYSVIRNKQQQLIKYLFWKKKRCCKMTFQTFSKGFQQTLDIFQKCSTPLQT